MTGEGAVGQSKAVDVPEAGPNDARGRKPVGYWRQQVALALQARRVHEPWWDANLKAYAPSPEQSPDRYGEHVNTNRDFVLVERKKADLFYQRPEVTLQPSPLLEQPRPQLDSLTGQPVRDPQTGQPVLVSDLPALAAHEQLVNEHLGPDRVDAVLMVHQALFDVLCTSGIGWTVMGYESVTVPVAQPDPRLPPELGVMQTVEVPLHERCFWHYVPPKRMVIPASWKSTEWDRAPFLGHVFTLPRAVAQRKFQLPEDFTPAKPGEGLSFRPAEDEDTADTITGIELWYRSALFRDDIRHPEHLTHLVLLDGLDVPALEEDCPYQTLDDRGQLTPDSLLGFPVHPLTVRVLTDSAYPPSDCTIIRPLVNELNKFRAQMVEYRDALTLRWQYNTDLAPIEAVGKFQRSAIGGMIGVPGDAFQQQWIKELPHGSMPRESFTSNDYIDSDIARTCGIDAAGAGVQSTSSATATEIQTVQANANARLDFERGRVLHWYVRGVTKFSTLLQRYLSVEDATTMVGPEAAQGWDDWRRRVPSALAFTAMPDSALRVDQAIDRKQALDFYQFVVNDPYVQKGRAKLLERLFRKYHLDPTGIVVAPDPPRPQPAPATLAFKGEDFVAPQAPIVVELVNQSGWQISPQAVQQSQGLLLQAAQLAAADAAAQVRPAGDTRHGGAQPRAEGLSKHHAEQTGALPGLGGAPAPRGGLLA